MRSATSIPHSSESSRRLIIVRGDLRSRTGLSYQLRAQVKLLKLLEADFDIVGVDVHPDPNDKEMEFPHSVINDEDVSRLIAESQLRPIVLHHTPPDDFICFPSAWNIGSFAWETDVAPRLRQWEIKIGFMDAMWAQCTMIADLIRNMGYTGMIQKITWPFDFGQIRRTDVRVRKAIKLRRFGLVNESGAEVQDITLADARDNSSSVFISVQSLSSRKGLPILLKEWHRHVSNTAKSNDLLILRLTFRHASNLSKEPEEHFASALRDAGFRYPEDVRIGIISSTLSDLELTELYQACDAYVSTTFGEGFGGPIIEAILNGRPVIVPRHTAMCDFIPPDYPLIIESVRRVVGLRGSLAVYPPASSWHIPVPGSLTACLAAFNRMTAAQRSGLVSNLRKEASQFCSVPMVKSAMRSLFRELLVTSAKTEGSGDAFDARS